MRRGDDIALPQNARASPVGFVHGTVRGRNGLFRPQRVAGGRHVRPFPGRSVLGERELARVFRRLPGGPPSSTSGPCGPHRRAAGARRSGDSPAKARRGTEVGGRQAGSEEATVLKGAASRIVANMEASLGVPTATSVRTVPARLLEVNRQILNNQLARTTGAKVSFTHLIGYAIVRALCDVPALNAVFVEDADGSGKPGIIHHKHVGLGLAVDQKKGDGSRTLLVPCIRDADTLDFRSFVVAYEDLIRKISMGKISPDDFGGTTVSLTNPGTLGTAQSVPRLMPGQGAIIGVGALGYPGRLRGGRSAGPGPARSGQGGDADLDLRPPHHSGGGVRHLLGSGGGPPDRGGRVLRRHLRVDGGALRAGPLAGGRQRRPRHRRG